MAYQISTYTDAYELDFDWEFADISYESAFGNSIFNKRLRFDRWSYGLTNLTAETAKEINDLRGFDFDISGNFLIEDYRVNIMLGCAQMDNLLRINKGSIKKSLIAYNVGQRGMTLGWGRSYYDNVKKERDLWLKFKSEEME